MAAEWLTLAVRTLHVLAGATLLGGAVALAAVAARSTDAGGVVSAARAYEWTFWAAVGVAVATGVGNLGALGDALPSTGTGWGNALALKLALVLALLVGSLARSFLVVRAAAPDAAARPAGAARALAVAYAATAAVLATVVAAAVGLAHWGWS